MGRTRTAANAATSHRTSHPIRRVLTYNTFAALASTYLLLVHHVIAPATCFTAIHRGGDRPQSPPPSPDSNKNDMNDKQPLQCQIDVTSDCSDHVLKLAAEFLVDNFWLGSPRQWLRSSPTAHHHTGATPYARNRLIRRQINDFTDQYFAAPIDEEHALRHRHWKSCFVWASYENRPLGFLAMNVLLLETATGTILSPDQSAFLLADAMTTLRPARRKLYQFASLHTLVRDVLPDFTVICYVSNVAVAPESRRLGVAQQLCTAAEDVARESGFTAMHLKVESENAAARTLYERKMGYTVAYTKDKDVGFRLDLRTGTLVETKVKAFILKHDL